MDQRFGLVNIICSIMRHNILMAFSLYYYFYSLLNTMESKPSDYLLLTYAAFRAENFLSTLNNAIGSEYAVCAFWGVGCVV